MYPVAEILVATAAELGEDALEPRRLPQCSARVATGPYRPSLAGSRPSGQGALGRGLFAYPRQTGLATPDGGIPRFARTA